MKRAAKDMVSSYFGFSIPLKYLNISYKKKRKKKRKKKKRICSIQPKVKKANVVWACHVGSKLKAKTKKNMVMVIEMKIGFGGLIKKKY